MRDQVYAGGSDSTSPFEFTGEVAAVFPDMISRSVPGYAATLKLIRSIADRVVTPGSRIYDLGCSLGSASLQIVDQIGERAEVIAVDTSEAMISNLNQTLTEQGITTIQTELGDIREFPIENATLTLLNFTLQFIPVEDRQDLITRIARGTRPGGALVLSEKIQFDDSAVQQEMTALHEAFKKANGYSELEISRKRTALENVLIPETLQAHKHRLHEAGFARCQVWFQCFNFVSLLAFKDD